MSKPNLNRFESKVEAVNHLMETVDPRSLLMPSYAREVAAPWGEEVVEKIDKIERTYEQQGAMPPADKSLDDTAVGAYQIVKLLVEEEGCDPIDEHAAGSGFYAAANFESNLPLLLDEIDGASPRDYDGRWRNRLQNKDRDIDVEGLYDAIETAEG
ncbi:hypothetical protein OB919_10400 [Halobacteria archaeon AArc-curdl1]|uniref:Uncharacterized protein n=1 Tax=Natronosalvus hydrolyticus TaxID=2979988 RepID=A0AAP2Z8U0_9EURY|nr:hypothetical protein [Halobacteria archaeon AArc-curdl1]